MNLKLRGFSLVELSIVLVILGLLVGGILAGQSMIRASQIQSVTTDYSRYQTAALAFRDKYMGVPGDITNATAFWGVAGGNGTGNDVNCRNKLTDYVQTCNGNGDKAIATSTPSREQFRMWQHLANAGLIEGRYAGVAGNEGGLAVNWYAPGTNVPKSKMGDMIFPWVMAATTPFSGNAYYFDGVMLGNALFFLTSDPNAPASVASMFRPEEAWKIDTKIDDGKPATGRYGVQWTADSVTGLPCTTATSSADLTANYALSEPTITCIPYSAQMF